MCVLVVDWSVVVPKVVNAEWWVSGLQYSSGVKTGSFRPRVQGQPWKAGEGTPAAP